MSGIRYTPKPVSTGIATRKIIVVPCMENIWLYVSGAMSFRFGAASCARITIASMPPARKKSREESR